MINYALAYTIMLCNASTNVCIQYLSCTCYVHTMYCVYVSVYVMGIGIDSALLELVYCHTRGNEYVHGSEYGIARGRVRDSVMSMYTNTILLMHCTTLALAMPML